MPNISHSRGFTLIELLTVVSIMSLLYSITFANLNMSRGKARDAQRISDMRTIVTALQAYYLDNNSWPFVYDQNAPENLGESCANFKCSLSADFGFQVTFCNASARRVCGYNVQGLPNETKWFTYLDDYFARGYAPHDPQNDRVQLPDTVEYRYVAYFDGVNMSFDFSYRLEYPNSNAIGNLTGGPCQRFCPYTFYGLDNGGLEL